MKKKLLIFFTLVFSFTSFSQISLLKDFAEGSKNGNPLILGVYKNKIYVNAINNSFQTKSYVYDGNSVEILKDNDGNETNISAIYIPEIGADDPMIVGLNFKTFTFNGSSFTEISDKRPWGGGIKFNGIYYFTAELNGKSPLFYTDGTATGTGYLKEDVKTLISWNVTERAVVNNTLIFVGDTQNEGTELWVTDGTEAGTVLLKDIYIGDKDSDPEDFFVTQDKSKLFFTAKTENEGRELWVTDGTASGTKLVKDIHTGTSGDDINSITEMNGNVYFEANGKLWKTDGTSENTIEIANGDERYLIVLNNELYFHEGKNMYKTDGTVAGTTQVNPANIGIEWSSFPIVFNNEIYFGGGGLDRNGNIDVNELWKTDGTTEGTVLVKVIDSDFVVHPSRFIKVGNELIFGGVTKNEGQELWRTDGTESGTMLIQDYAAGSTGFIANFTTSVSHAVVNNTLVFSANANKGLGVELYEYKNGATASVNNFFQSKLQLHYSENTIHLKNWEPKNPTLKIYNILGKEVLDTSVKKTQSSIEVNLKKGVYIARYFSEKGNLIGKKFLVD
ncbi:T9SS type A sorting domain-containing protein [Polaribacter septentrionalilitoris]|uniref:T9SS type A sorting domain-containing protein n=1 Tax=Polaribacter septentrionalilitoris TaxID=2494657 RepID=UPI0013587C3F|nr:T9SS type A sorting domain-containing protein [Polaribacter septentrionalilitoris]